MADNPFYQTLEKLVSIKQAIEIAATIGDWDTAEKEADTLRDYATCFYCLKYRAALLGHSDGICGACPCHSLGEKILGRKRGCNGCYVVNVYRDLVRNAHWFEEVKSEDSVRALLKCIQNVIDYMGQNKAELGG